MDTIGASAKSVFLKTTGTFLPWCAHGVAAVDVIQSGKSGGREHSLTVTSFLLRSLKLASSVMNLISALGPPLIQRSALSPIADN